MTWEMYEGLHAACERAGDDPAIKVVVLRGAGDKAFVAGTDIAQFEDFASGADGVAYEARFTRIIDRLENVDVPTVVAVRGACVGGGLAIAAACDLRVATESARFGVPIARTLGNCLSSNSMSFLLFHLGPAVTLDLLLRAELLTGPEAYAQGFVRVLTADDGLDATVDEGSQPRARDDLGGQGNHPPSPQTTARRRRRRRLRRVRQRRLRRCRARAFATKSPPQWRGR